MISQFSSKIQSGNSQKCYFASWFCHRILSSFFRIAQWHFSTFRFFLKEQCTQLLEITRFEKKAKQWLMYFVSPGNTLCCELVIAVMSICLAIISKVTFSSMFKEESTWPCVNVPICRQVSSLALLKMNHNCWAKSTLLFSIFLANGTKRKIRSIVKISGGFWRAILMRLRYKRTHTDFNHKEPASFFLWTGENSQISLGNQEDDAHFE